MIVLGADGKETTVKPTATQQLYSHLIGLLASARRGNSDLERHIAKLWRSTHAEALAADSSAGNATLALAGASFSTFASTGSTMQLEHSAADTESSGADLGSVRAELAFLSSCFSVFDTLMAECETIM